MIEFEVSTSGPLLPPMINGRGAVRHDPRQDGLTIVGGIVLSAVVIAALLITLALSLAIGEAQRWHPVGWLAIGALLALLLSLQVLFVRDYLRWRRASRPRRR